MIIATARWIRQILFVLVLLALPAMSFAQVTVLRSCNKSNVGSYGGIDYGFGYFGDGYEGGRVGERTILLQPFRDQRKHHPDPQRLQHDSSQQYDREPGQLQRRQRWN